jgi:hypothetical protein
MGNNETTPAALRDLPEYWLGELDRAIRRGDYSSAARANAELERLGYHVRASAGQRGDGHHATS